MEEMGDIDEEQIHALDAYAPLTPNKPPQPDSKYHSSKFLVVRQPDQASYSIAVVDAWYAR